MRYKGLALNIGTYLLLPLLAMLISCATVGQGGLQGELEHARSQWRLARPADYVYRFQLNCFCPREITQPVLITVKNSTVEEVVYADTRQPVEPMHMSNYHTVDQLFDMLQEALDQTPHQMAVSYDPTYGYPTSANIDYSEMIADEEMRFLADSLMPLQK